MPPSSTKTLSPAELAKLEHAFATDPASDAYRPLAEAYLGMGRFMEAMVVCKKGVKAHPTDADPRVLLARVYAEQGKDRKALEELQGALQVAPTDKVALRMAGSLQMKVGELEAGKSNLLKAHESDPTDAETQAVMGQWSVAPPAPAKPPSPPPPMLEPVDATPVAPQRAASAHPASESPRSNRPPPPPQEDRPLRRPAPREDRGEPISEVSDISGVYRSPRRSSSSSKHRGTFMLLLIGGVLALGAYWGVGTYRARRLKEFNILRREADKFIKKDSYASYKKAADIAQDMESLDPASPISHAYLAYIYAIEWGEHAMDTRPKALDELQKAKNASEDITAYSIAADALVQTYSGKGADAVKSLSGKLKQYGDSSALLNLTAGICMMNAGYLEQGRERLDKAQRLASDDARVYSALGTLYRLRGQDAEALRSFDFALRFEPDHPESQLGKVLLLLDQDDPNYFSANKQLKKLLDSQPPPSKRQIAMAQMARALLISRLTHDLPDFKPEGQKELLAATGLSTDKDKNKADVLENERSALQLDPQNPELYLLKGKRLLLEDNFDGGVAEIRRAIKMDPSRSQFSVELARALMNKQGGEKEAEEALRNALSQNANSPKLRAMLGHVLMRQNKLDDALHEYEKSFEDPTAKNPEARISMGRIYREKKDFTQAIDSFTKASTEYVGQKNRVAASYDELGVTYQARGDASKAQESYDKAMNADPDYEGTYCHEAKLLSSDSKNRSRVRELAKEYLKRAPKGDCAAEAERLAES